MRKPIQANRSPFVRDGFAFVHDVLSFDEIEIFAPIFSERLPADKLPPGIPDAGLNGRKTLISEHTDPPPVESGGAYASYQSSRDTNRGALSHSIDLGAGDHL